VIVIRQSAVIDTIIVWDTKHDTELEAYDVEGDYITIWDMFGNPYIITRSCVIMAV
jgi:hypothetical protein